MAATSNVTVDEAAASFEAGQKLLRDAFAKVTMSCDAELARLRTELVRRDTKIEELQKKVARLVDELQKANQKTTELTGEVERLYAFRKNILESFDDRDLSELRVAKTGYRPTPAVAAGPTLSSPPRTSALRDELGFGADAGTDAERTSAGRYAGFDRHKPNGATGAMDSINFDLISEDGSEFDLRPLASGVTAPGATMTSKGFASSMRTSIVDGKDFFNNARSRLSYDKFSTLLAHIQRYNRREKTKEETLEALGTLLEGKNRDLYEQFAAMVNQ